MLDTIRNWFEVRAAMKDARRLRAGQAVLNTVVVIDKLKHVSEMLQVGQREYATVTMDEILARYPEECAELPETIGILINLGRLDDAEALTMRGMQRNPDSRDFVRLYGEIADHRDDTAERLRRWRAFRRRYPAYGLSFRAEANALLAAGDEAAADDVLAEGMRIVTDDVGLAIEYADRATRQRDWPEAIRRWAIVRDRFSHSWGTTRTADALVAQGLFDQAEAELLTGRRLYPLEAQLVDDLATLAERRGNVDEALRYWAELRRDLPQVVRGYTEAARLLRARGEDAAADALITEAAMRWPDDHQLQYAYGEIAERSRL